MAEIEYTSNVDIIADGIAKNKQNQVNAGIASEVTISGSEKDVAKQLVIRDISSAAADRDAAAFSDELTTTGLSPSEVQALNDGDASIVDRTINSVSSFMTDVGNAVNDAGTSALDFLSGTGKTVGKTVEEEFEKDSDYKNFDENATPEEQAEQTERLYNKIAPKISGAATDYIASSLGIPGLRGEHVQLVAGSVRDWLSDSNGLPEGVDFQANEEGVLSSIVDNREGQEGIYSVQFENDQYTLVDEDGTVFDPEDIGVSQEMLKDTQAGLSGEIGSSVVANVAAEMGTDLRTPQAVTNPTEFYIIKKTDEFRVTLHAMSDPSQKIVFKASPEISESQSATYDTVSPVHHPGSIQSYRSTTARSLSMETRLISRTISEATENIAYMNLLRAWMMPYYGVNTARNTDKLGAPPEVLVLNAYGDKNLVDIPVVLVSRSLNYPNDIDYIHSMDGEAIPRIVNVSLTLMESYSPREYTNFDIVKYREGDLSAAFGRNK